jgi:chromosome segregation ATPase
VTVDVSVQTALIAAATGLLTLVGGDLLRRWKTGRDAEKDEALVRHIGIEGDTTTMEALTNAFRAISERQADDINDLRERLRRVEDALLVAQERNTKLADANELLREEIGHLRTERDHAQARVEQLEGDLRLQGQAGAPARVYGQDEA